MVIGELSSVVLSFLRGKEGAVDGDSGKQERPVILSQFSDFTKKR